MMSYEKERKEMLFYCQELSQKGFFLGTWGNLSVRVPEGLLVTPSRLPYAQMKAEDMVLLDLAGRQLEGKRIPTSEREVHRQIYCRRHDIGAIVHTHTEAAMAVSALKISRIPCLVEEMAQLLGGDIPLTKEYISAEQHERLGGAASEDMGSANAVLLRNHGAVACGKNLEEAFLAAAVVEKGCRIFLDTSAAVSGYEGIPGEFIASEHYRYQHTYGKEK